MGRTTHTTLVNRRVDWASYLADFHQAHPGITEDVLTRCRDTRSQNPYEWLVDGVGPGARVLDVGCGSAPSQPLVGPAWIGIDRSSAELHRAQITRRADVVRADAILLPIRSCSVDVVVCSLALMLFDNVDAALFEIARVLVPGGELRATLPHHKSLTARDRLQYAGLASAARAIPRFPATPLDGGLEAFRDTGLGVTSDEARRFTYPLDDPQAIKLFVDSWYTSREPTASERARSTPLPRGRRRTIGIGLRRIIARRQPTFERASFGDSMEETRDVVGFPARHPGDGKDP